MAVEHVVVGTGGVGTRFINHDYPNTDGLIAGTTKQEGHAERLVPEEASLVSNRDKALID
jgi:hypothetical protein